MRALVCVRLSRLSDESTSPERQLEKCLELCAERGWKVVGVAEDLDVSAGSTSPFERPELGDWLNNRGHEFDTLVFFRADRVVRRLFDLADLIRWSREHSVTLVSATERHFDLSTDFGDILALLVAKVAEMELAAISERNSSAFRHNIKMGKWRGGMPPWGYVPSNESGEWRLIQDPTQVRIIHEVVRRVLDGEPLRSIANDLTGRQVPTPSDGFAASRGRATKGHAWHSSPLKRSLTSPTLLGFVVTREPLLDSSGKPTRDAKGRKLYGPEIVLRESDGSPVVRAEPILSREVFDRLGAELAERENRKEPTKRSNGLLLRIAYCAVCAEPAYKLKGGKGRADRYRCRSASAEKACGAGSIKMPVADSLVEKTILALLGDSVRLERVWDPGTDHSAELARLNTELIDMTSLIGTPSYPANSPQRAALDGRIAALAERQKKLAADAVKPASWEWESTDEKFVDWWTRQDVAGRNMWLRSSGIRFYFDGEKNRHLDMGGLNELLSRLLPGGFAKKLQHRFSEMRAAGIAGIEQHSDKTVTVVLEDGQQFRVDMEPHQPTEEQEAEAAQLYGWR